MRFSVILGGLLLLATTAQAQQPSSLFGIQEQRRIERLEKQIADQQAREIAGLQMQIQQLNLQLNGLQLQQRQLPPPPLAVPVPIPPAPPQIIQYHIYIPNAPGTPNPGTPQFNPNPGTPQFNPNPGTPQLNPNPGTPQLNPNPGVPKINPNPGPPIQMNPNPGGPLIPQPYGAPGPGTSTIPGYQIYNYNYRPPVIEATRTPWISR